MGVAFVSYHGESFKRKITEINNGKKTIGKQWTPRKEDGNTTTSRWQNDEQYRTSQLAIGWTETHCGYLDYLTTIDISHHAPCHQRSLYESTVTMKSNDPNPQSGPMWKTEDYRATPDALLSLLEEQSRTNTNIPKNMRTRKKNTLDPGLQRKLEWPSQNWKTSLLNTDFVLFSVMVAQLV